MKSKRRTIAVLVDSLSSEYTVQAWQTIKRAATAENVDTMVLMGLRLGAPNVSESTTNRIYELVGPARFDGVIVVSWVLAHYCGVVGISALCRRSAPLPLCSIGLSIEGVP